MSRPPSRRELLRASGALAPALLLACKADELAARPPATSARAREVARVVPAQPTIDGAGVHLRRSIGGAALANLDPFLLLDEFHSDRPEDYVKGFPDHPHRGFETVTYMLHGAMEHRDSMGNHGRLGPGSTQWMTAGHGIIHSEMPKQVGGLMWGFQLWVNLPAHLKLTKPRYQDLAPERIPEITLGAGKDAARVRVVAGEAGGVRGPVDGIAIDPLFLDVTLAPGVDFRHAVPATHAAFAYVVEGSARLGGGATRVNASELAVLGDGDEIVAKSDEGGRILVLAGAPIGEPIARWGPFVMNTQAEIRKAIEDYRGGRLVDG